MECQVARCTPWNHIPAPTFQNASSGRSQFACFSFRFWLSLIKPAVPAHCFIAVAPNGKKNFAKSKYWVSVQATARRMILGSDGANQMTWFNLLRANLFARGWREQTKLCLVSNFIARQARMCKLIIWAHTHTNRGLWINKLIDKRLAAWMGDQWNGSILIQCQPEQVDLIELSLLSREKGSFRQKAN